MGLMMRRTWFEFPPDHRFDLGMTGQQCAIVVEHGNGRVFSKCHGREELFEMGGLDTSPDGSQEFAIPAGQLAGEDGRPNAGHTTLHQFDQKRWRLWIGFEGFEIGSIGGIDGRNRPGARRIDQCAVRIEQVDAADIGQCADLGLKHQVSVRAGHLTPVVFAGIDSGCLHVGDKVSLNRRDVIELPIEVAGQQQYGVFQFAFAVVQRALSEIADHDRRADRDRRNQEYAAKDKPADRTAANGMFEDEGGGPVYRHWS